MNTSRLVFTFLALVVTAAAQPYRGGKGRACGGAANASCPAVGTAPVTLSAPARDALLFQIEEERMAREIYAALEAQWALRPFRRIQGAEQRHEEALRALAARAGLTPPTAVAGKFASPLVQQRYDELLARGLRSATEALAAGAAVERQDIADLQTLIGSTDSAELKEVARVLADASARHLAAFEGRQHERGRPAGLGCGAGRMRAGQQRGTP